MTSIICISTIIKCNSTIWRTIYLMTIFFILGFIELAILKVLHFLLSFIEWSFYPCILTKRNQSTEKVRKYKLHRSLCTLVCFFLTYQGISNYNHSLFLNLVLILLIIINGLWLYLGNLGFHFKTTIYSNYSKIRIYLHSRSIIAGIRKLHNGYFKIKNH